MTYNELAELIIEERNKIAEHNPKTPYYFLNVGHPALLGLYADWKPSTTPPSDKERIVWELKLLNADALKKIAERFKREDNCGR